MTYRPATEEDSVEKMKDLLARSKWWLSALGAAGALLIGLAPASAGRSDLRHKPPEPNAKVGEYTFILHGLLVRPYVNSPATRKLFEDRYGADADPSLPSGRVIVVSDVRATGESRQFFIAGPEQFTRKTGEDLEFEQWVYHAKDCTPYDRVIVTMNAYLIPTGSELPGPIAKLVQQGGLVAEGNGERAQAAREQLAKLGADSDVIPLGQYEGAFPDPATDPERQDHEFANSVGRTLRSRIRYQLTNQYEIGGPCTHIAVTAKTTAASPAVTPNRPPVLKPILAWYVPDPSQTTYEVDISDPDPADKVTVAWTLAPSSCGKFDQLEVVGSAVAGGTAKAFATWRHASSNGCEHAGAPDDHAGTISVVVSDGHWTCAASFLRGAKPGNGPAPRTCHRIGAAATTVKPG